MMNKIQILIAALFILFNVSCKNENSCCQNDKNKIMISDSGLSCNLTDENFRKRKAFLKKEIFSAIDQIDELENGYLFKFKEIEGFDTKLMELLVAERTCCPFFEIKLHLLPYKKGINVAITGQEGVKEFLKTELLD